MHDDDAPAQAVPTDDDVLEFRVDGVLGAQGSTSELERAVAIAIAALRRLGASQGLGALRTAVLSFDHAPVAVVCASEGVELAAVGTIGAAQLPGALLARLRRSCERDREET